MKIDRDLQTEWMEKACIRMGQELDEAMKTRGVSVEWLAAQVGMLPYVLNKYISGEMYMSIGMYDLLMSILDYQIRITDFDGNLLPVPEEEEGL